MHDLQYHHIDHLPRIAAKLIPQQIDCRSISSHALVYYHLLTDSSYHRGAGAADSFEGKTTDALLLFLQGCVLLNGSCIDEV